MAEPTTTIIGIDLGTTNSLASHLDGAAPRLIPNALGEFFTPSVVGVGLDGHLIVGREARELMVLHPDRCAAQFKRRMGTDWSIQLGGRTFRPEELSAAVLQALKRDAEAALGHPVERAVITVPASFNDDQPTQGDHRRRHDRRAQGRADLERADRRGAGLRLPGPRVGAGLAHLRPRRRDLRRVDR